jgi:predicted small metal-binding protein
MKVMTCNQLGGACDLAFSGSTFDEVAAQSQQHGKEMFGRGDAPHLAAMQKMMEIMNVGGMDSWMAARASEFDALT